MNGAKIQQRALTAPRSRSPGRGGAVGIRTTSPDRPPCPSHANVSEEGDGVFDGHVRELGNV